MRHRFKNHPQWSNNKHADSVGDAGDTSDGKGRKKKPGSKATGEPEPSGRHKFTSLKQGPVKETISPPRRSHTCEKRIVLVWNKVKQGQKC